MTAPITHLNPPTLSRNPMFTQAVIVSGDARTVYIGGQTGVAAAGAIVGAGDLAALLVAVDDRHCRRSRPTSRIPDLRAPLGHDQR